VTSPRLFLPLRPVVNCTDPGIPANSIRESKIEHGVFTFGSVVFYDCNPGYFLFGSPVLSCQPEGRWDKPLPECIGTVALCYRGYGQRSAAAPLPHHCICADVNSLMERMQEMQMKRSSSCLSPEVK